MGDGGRPDGASEPPRGRALLLGVAFTAGWVGMTLEILGGRLLAPYFGASVHQWGAVIGVVLAALSGGYYVGGRLGDGARATSWLLGALALAAALILLVPPLSPALLPWARAFGPARGAVVAAAVLLGPPSFLLGIALPIVVRLTVTDRIATSAGAVYAVSTLGSIGGTFFTAFYSIPVLGTSLSHSVAAGLTIAAVVALAIALRRTRMVGVGRAPRAAGPPGRAGAGSGHRALRGIRPQLDPGRGDPGRRGSLPQLHGGPPDGDAEARSPDGRLL